MADWTGPGFGPQIRRQVLAEMPHGGDFTTFLEAGDLDR